jgi:hypothetical protein
MPQIPPPIPIQTLPYFRSSEHGTTVMLLRAIIVAVIAMAVLHLLASLTTIVGPMANFPFGMGPRVGDWSNTSLMIWALELCGDAAAIVVIVGAVRCFSLRRSAAPLLAGSAISWAAIQLIHWGVRMWIIMGSPNFLSRTSSLTKVIYALNSVSFSLPRLLLPLLIAWALTRPQVKQCFSSGAAE